MGAHLAVVTEIPRVEGDASGGRSDRELLASLDASEPTEARAALAELYARHAAATLTFLQRLVGEREAAEDALQSAFLAVARRGREHRGGSVRAWILSIAANRARDELRSRARRERRERASARDEAVVATFPVVLDEELEAALAQLTPNHRAALELRFAQGLTHAKCAQILGVSLRTAKTWSAAGLAELRALLDGDRT